MPLEAGHFAKLKAHYTDRALVMKQARAQGSKIVARAGSAVPAELILAAGFMPMLVAADLSRATPTAAKYLDDIVPRETHALFEAAARGDFDEVELLVLSRAYDKLYFYLKEIYRQGLLPGLPPLHMFDLMQNRRAALARFNADRLSDLRLRLERAAGAPISDAALHDAIVLCNRARAAQRALLNLRWQGNIDGEAAMQAIGAGYFMHPADYAEALDGYLAQLHAASTGAARPRLLLATAEPLSHTTLHAAVERAGGRIVAEDDWWGARAPGGDVSLDLPPMEALLAKHCFDTVTAESHPVEDRLAWFEEAAQRSEVDGVIFYLPPSDLHYGWDYPRLRARLRAQAKPFLLIREDASTSSGRTHFAEEAASFIGQIHSLRVDKAGAVP